MYTKTEIIKVVKYLETTPDYKNRVHLISELLDDHLVEPLDERITNLMRALRDEYESLPPHNALGLSNHLEQYPVVVEYLKTGIAPDDYPEEWDLLNWAINDIHYLYDCYEV